MKKVTRKHFWPVSLVAALAVIGLLAAVMALAGAPGAALAQDPPPNPFTPPTVTPTTTGTPGGTATQQPTAQPTATRPASTLGVPDKIESSSTSANATVKLTLTIGNLPEDMLGGSSIELYLEDDFKVPDTIARDSVYFTVENPRDNDTSNGGRVYATDPIDIDTDGHFTADKDDYAIQVVIPDMNTADRPQFDGFQGPKRNQTLKLVFTKDAGIKNASEAGTHSVGYSVLGPNDDTNDGPEVTLDGVADSGAPLSTVGKISLSDVDNTRGYDLTVTGTGFNNGTSAAVHVLHAVDAYPAWWDSLSCAEKNAVAGSRDTERSGYCQSWASLNATQQAAVRAISLLGGGAAESTFCRHIIRAGHRAGIAEVGTDDTVAVEFEVTVPIFGPGNTNYICMVDGEGRSSGTDVEDFELEPSIRVSPTSASVGDTINVYAQDYPNTGAGFTSLEVANQVVYRASDTPANRVNIVSVNAGTISNEGSATVTFEMPGSVGGSPLEGTVRIDAEWGNVSEDAKITLTGSTLRLSAGEARANDSVTIQGEGFGSGRNVTVDPANITIDGVPLIVDDDSLDDGVVDVSNAGQFVATVYLWNDASVSDNPALIAGTHTIRVRDSAGFYGTATIAIKEPSMTITPDVLGPRDYLTVTGNDWPVDNQDSDADTGNVVVTVEDRNYTVVPDATGRFTVEHRVSRRVAIPSTQQVEATYQEGLTKHIVKTASFEVPAASIEIDPLQGQPGDEVSLTVEGMPVYTEVEEITIGGARVGGNRDFRTDRDGNLTADDLPIPGLDPGTYSVIMKVGSGDSQTVAIGSLEVQPEVAPGATAMLPDALENLDDNLVAVFYFDNVSKAWSFFDPREEFEDLNTLSELIDGEAYWILVEEAAEEVVLNNKTYNLSCSTDGDCWNLEVW